MDVQNVFLHGVLKEEVYLDPPPGFVVNGWDLEDNLFSQNVLIWINIVPRAWFERFNTTVIKYGIQRCNVDHTVFVRRWNMKVVILVVYVDDIVAIGNDDDEISRLKDLLSMNLRSRT